MIFSGEINTSISLARENKEAYPVKCWKLTVTGASGYDESFAVFDDVLRSLHSICWIVKFYNNPSFVVHSSSLANPNLQLSVQGDENHALITFSAVKSPYSFSNTVIFGSSALSDFMNFLASEINS